MTERSRRIDPAELRAVFERAIPFNRFLGVQVLDIGEGSASMELPYRPELIGNPLLQALHGGVMSTLLDSCGGVAVWSQVGVNDMVATVDLRVDYLRPGLPENLRAVGQVVRLGNRVGVVSLRAFHPGREDRPVAAGTGVYNIRRASGGTSDAWQRLLASAS